MKILLLVCVIAVARAQLLINHGSCQNRCFTANDYMKSCQCDSDCESFKNCCSDFRRRCRGSEYGLVVTQQELDNFAQSLWDNDANRIDSALYTLNYQGQTNRSSEDDVASNPLLQPTDSQLDAILSSPNATYQTFIQLLDNYEVNVKDSEQRPLTEIQEEDAFWAIASQTRDMQLTFEFLRDNGFIKGDPHAFRTVINELWFESYVPRHGGHIQSGFETVMIGEKTKNLGHKNNNTVNNHINGFSNWVQYYQEQQAGNLDYQGYINYLQDPSIVDVRFLWHNAMAKEKVFFVGTSPEFDMGLYTVCALVRRNRACSVTINGQQLTVFATDSQHQDILQLSGIQLHFQSTTTPPINP